MTTIKEGFGTRVAFSTLTALHSLASDTNLLAGWQSGVIDNTTDQFYDEIISGRIYAGTSPTVSKTIEVWAWGILEAAGPTYPDSIGGSAGAVTLTSTNTKLAGAFGKLATITVDATSNRPYDFEGSLRAALGFMPDKWGVFAVHNTGVAIKSSGSNLWHLPIAPTNS